MNIVKKQLEELRPLEKNVRKHSDIQIKEFARSIKQFGQTRAFVIDEQNNILVGNGMYEAMRTLGETYCDCYVIAGLSEIEKKKLILSDNKIFELGCSDYAITDEFIKEIVSSGDTDVAGFDPDILENIVNFTQFSEQKQSEYGRVSPEDFKAIEAAAVRVEPRVAVQETLQETRVESYQQPTMPQAAERRYIICPHCNERIEL